MTPDTVDLSTLKVGDEYPVWWFTGKRIGNWNIARVIDIKPYRGQFSEYYTLDLKLTAPNTDRGWMEMAV